MNTRIVWNLAAASIVVSSFCAHAQSATSSFGQVKTDLTHILDTLTADQVQELLALLERRLAVIPKPATSGSYTTLALDLSLQKLGPGFAGQDPQQIYNALIEKFGPKQEFETTQQYQDRLLSEKEKPLIGALTPHTVFASTTDHSNDNGTGKAKMVYDADRQVLQITAYLSPVVSDTLSFRDAKQAITVKTVEKAKGTYVGENAYGAKRDVLKVDTNVYYVIFNNLQDFGINRGDFVTEVKFDVPMDAEAAKVVKPNLRILLLYRLVEPFTQSTQILIRPKVDDPREGEINHNYLNAKVEAVWFYNFETGVIYRKLRPADK